MNKAKVDKIIEEVLTEIELDDAKKQLAEWYKVVLCDRLNLLFDGARRHARGWTNTVTKKEAKENEKTLTNKLNNFQDNMDSLQEMLNNFNKIIIRIKNI